MAGRSPQVLLEQPFQPLSEPGDEESVIERKEGDFKYFSKGKKQPNASTAGDVRASEPPTRTGKLRSKRETRYSKPAFSIAHVLQETGFLRGGC